MGDRYRDRDDRYGYEPDRGRGYQCSPPPRRSGSARGSSRPRSSDAYSPLRRDGGGRESDPKIPQGKYKITVSYIPDDMPWGELKDLGRQYGPSLTFARTYRDKSGIFHGLIEFRERGDAENVIRELHNRRVEGSEHRLRAQFGDVSEGGRPRFDDSADDRGAYGRRDDRDRREPPPRASERSRDDGDRDSFRADRDRGERDRSDRDHCERDRGDRDRCERDRGDRDRCERDRGDRDQGRERDQRDWERERRDRERSRSPPARRGSSEEIMTLFLNKLPDDAREDEIKDDFAPVAKVGRVMIMRKGEGETSAFVRFFNARDAEDAMAEVRDGKLKICGTRVRADMARTNTSLT